MINKPNISQARRAVQLSEQKTSFINLKNISREGRNVLLSCGSMTCIVDSISANRLIENEIERINEELKELGFSEF